jgi:hypothetical protein
MSRSGRRAPAYIRTPSSSLGRSQARVPLLEMSGAAHRPPSTDRSSTRSSSLMSRSGRRIGAYIRQATAGADFRDAGSENEGVRKRSDSSKLVLKCGDVAQIQTILLQSLPHDLIQCWIWAESAPHKHATSRLCKPQMCLLCP